jgi:hypothetical protein
MLTKRSEAILTGDIKSKLKGISTDESRQYTMKINHELTVWH